MLRGSAGQVRPLTALTRDACVSWRSSPPSPPPSSTPSTTSSSTSSSTQPRRPDSQSCHNHAGVVTGAPGTCHKFGRVCIYQPQNDVYIHICLCADVGADFAAAVCHKFGQGCPGHLSQVWSGVPRGTCHSSGALVTTGAPRRLPQPQGPCRNHAGVVTGAPLHFPRPTTK